MHNPVLNPGRSLSNPRAHYVGPCACLGRRAFQGKWGNEGWDGRCREGGVPYRDIRTGYELDTSAYLYRYRTASSASRPHKPSTKGGGQIGCTPLWWGCARVCIARDKTQRGGKAGAVGAGTRWGRCGRCLGLGRCGSLRANKF